MRRAVVLVIAFVCWGEARAGEEPLVVTADLTLPEGAVLRAPLVIAADNVTVEGNGAVIEGPGKAGDPASFRGAGIRAEGRSFVRIRNLKVRGFESGLVAKNGKGWCLERCDFSNNYHDPDYDWGDYKRVGGIILTGISESVIRECRANSVWNGLDLRECSGNLIEKNDFSHCSNVCLKLWTACRNTVRDNDLSYGLRISPGEVHARDSTSVLIESGSDDNRFERNDVTHGGDGIFIRVLNGWTSRRNVFIENDCSYANNNGFEAWSPDNTYIRNKANWCSYGFWLGGSDHTVLIENEAGYNGMGFRNAPEGDFNHGGIVIVHGTGTHSVIEGNWCHHNAGAGIVVRGDLGTRGAKWKMHHLIMQSNRLEANRWGIFARFTDWLDLAGNTYLGNEVDEFFEDVTNLARRPGDPEGRPAPKAVLEGPELVKVGERAVYDVAKSEDAAGRPLAFRWDAGGVEYTAARVEHAFPAPGFHRVGVTVTNGFLAGLAFKDVYAVADVDELATEGHASQWGWAMGSGDDGAGRVELSDDAVALCGKTSVRMRPSPHTGGSVTAFFPGTKNAAWDLAGKTRLVFWLKFENENIGGFGGPNPIVRLHAREAAYTYLPALAHQPRNLLGDFPYSEARHGWLRIVMPLGASEDWIRTEDVAGGASLHVDNGLVFRTFTAPFETQGSSSMVSGGDLLFCATLDGEALFASPDGREWTERTGPAEGLGCDGAAWNNGMLAYRAGPEGGGHLYLRHTAPERDEFGQNPAKLVAYDIAADKWSWLPTAATMGHGAAVAGDHLFGLAHAVMGNYGGPLCRVDLRALAPFDERSEFSGIKGDTAPWLSRAAQLALADGKIYGIKNDWTTPQPADKEKCGDRLYCFDPKDYAPSRFAGGNRWDEKKWRVEHTPAVDLGALPFEVGHGAALAVLPPAWSPAVGARGGLFILAGESPSDHEGFGAPSSLYAIYDIARGAFTVGRLPAETASGTSAAFHKGKVYVKRGGVHFGPHNREVWEVAPAAAGEAAALEAQARRQRMSLARVEYLSIQLEAAGGEPFSVWLDGMAFE
ncbi:MAG TPA: hypothetical protein DCM87_19000 [Planctomycetes bacterium]|nr:hypothetical protein [Planctomycetota bacterium]